MDSMTEGDRVDSKFGQPGRQASGGVLASHGAAMVRGLILRCAAYKPIHVASRRDTAGDRANSASGQPQWHNKNKWPLARLHGSDGAQGQVRAGTCGLQGNGGVLASSSQHLFARPKPLFTITQNTVQDFIYHTCPPLRKQ